MKNSLINITFNKEIIHWKRMRQLFNEMSGIGGKFIAYPLLVVIISLCHYAFVLMHSAFEIFLFFFNKEQFKKNMSNINQEIIDKYFNYETKRLEIK